METKNFIVDNQNSPKRLDVFLQEQMPDFSRNKIKTLIDKKCVKVDNFFPSKSGQMLKCGQVISVEIPAPTQIEAKPENLNIEIVYQDDDLAVINKPQGMVVHAGAGNAEHTLVNALLFHIKNLSGINGELRPGIVHRLDKNTAGLMVVAKNDFAHKILAKQIEEKTCHRQYVAILEGNVKQDEGTITTHISRHKKNRKIMAVCDDTEGKIAITEFKVLERFSGYTFAQFNLKTGRTHQIRVHCKDVLHCPIANDVEYGGHPPKILTKKHPKSLGQYLVSEKIEFVHPRTQNVLSFSIPLPPYFEAFLNELKNKNNT